MFSDEYFYMAQLVTHVYVDFEAESHRPVTRAELYVIVTLLVRNRL